MIKFCVRNLLLLGLFFLPAITFASSQEFYPHRPQLVSQDSRSVRTTLIDTDKFIVDESEPARKLFAGLLRRDRDLHADQIKTVLVKREKPLSTKVIASMQRTDRYEAGGRIASTDSQIRGKNSGIVHMRVNGKILVMDDYIQGTRLDLGGYIVKNPAFGKIASQGIGVSG